MLEINKIHCIDVCDGLKQLENSSADIIIADPPYNIGKDFGNNIDKKDDYFEWCNTWIKECIRVIKPNGTIFIYGFSEILANIFVNIPINKRWLIWHYTNKNVATLEFWQRSHESIIACWKNKPIFNTDLVREPYTEMFLNNAAGKKRKGMKSRYGSGEKDTIYNAHENGALPRDVIKIPSLAGGSGISERWFICRNCDNKVYHPTEFEKHMSHDTVKHPTQKPLELCGKLINSAMIKNGFVVIPFAGIGSECVAAKKLEQSFIGFEINPEYIRIADVRLNEKEYHMKQIKKLELFE